MKMYLKFCGNQATKGNFFKRHSFNSFRFTGFLLPLLLSFNTSGQVTTLNSWSNVYHGTSDSESPTYAIPTGSNTNRLLVVAVATSRTTVGTRSVTLTYGGQSLTLVNGDLSNASARQHTALYYLNESGIDAASNTTLSITISGGTTRVNDVWASVYDNVDQSSPITDSQQYSSNDANTTNPSFGTSLNLSTNDLPVKVVSSVRVGNTSARTFTAATNWTLNDQQTFTTTDGVRNAVATRSIPLSNTTDNASMTFSGNARGSMTGMSLTAAPGQFWYTYQDGVWSNPDVWTLDPTGTTLVNPYTTYPSNGDAVTILNGYTITNDLIDQTLVSMAIESGGVLDMSTTTGVTLGEVTGGGRLRVDGINLPTGDYTAFVASTGGTIEYYNTGGTLPTGQTTYNNLVLNNTTNSDITYVTTNNLTINGNLSVTQTGSSGTVTWQINDASNTQRTMTLNGNLTVHWTQIPPYRWSCSTSVARWSNLV
jgi:hypothetical protein